MSILAPNLLSLGTMKRTADASETRTAGIMRSFARPAGIPSACLKNICCDGNSDNVRKPSSMKVEIISRRVSTGATGRVKRLNAAILRVTCSMAGDLFIVLRVSMGAIEYMYMCVCMCVVLDEWRRVSEDGEEGEDGEDGNYDVYRRLYTNAHTHGRKVKGWKRYYI